MRRLPERKKYSGVLEKYPKGTTINDLGVGLKEIEKKKLSEALLREKIIRKGFPGKNKFILKIPPLDHWSSPKGVDH